MATTILLSAFVISLVARAFFIVAMIKGWFDPDDSVAWHVVSADTHRVSGNFAFAVK